MLFATHRSLLPQRSTALVTEYELSTAGLVGRLRVHLLRDDLRRMALGFIERESERDATVESAAVSGY